MNQAGKISKNKDGYYVRFDRILPFPQQEVWDAITNPNKLKRWFTDIEMDFVPGGKMTIRFRDTDKTESHGTILRIQPPTLFEYLWEDELATWELQALDNATRLTLTYSKFDESYAFSVPAGWHILLNQLNEVLHGSSKEYAFGGEETEHAKDMKARYKEIVMQQYPTTHT